MRREMKYSMRRERNSLRRARNNMRRARKQETGAKSAQTCVSAGVAEAGDSRTSREATEWSSDRTSCPSQVRAQMTPVRFVLPLSHFHAVRFFFFKFIQLVLFFCSFFSLSHSLAFHGFLAESHHMEFWLSDSWKAHNQNNGVNVFFSPPLIALI